METETKTNGNGNGTALVKAQPAVLRVATAYEPRSSAEAYQMAAWFAKSGFLGEVGTPDKVFFIMATGADLGIPATTALRQISIIKGRPALAADLMKAMCLARREICDHFRLLKSDDKIATYSAKRAGDDPVIMSFTMEDAARAKLKDRGDDKSDNNYNKYPAAMLRHRATAQLAREVFPDIVGGIYCPEEAADFDDPRIVEAQVIDTEAVNDLEERISAFEKRIEDAKTPEALKAINADVDVDPAKEVIRERLKDAYNARLKTIKEGGA